MCSSDLPAWVSTYEPAEYLFGFWLGGRGFWENAVVVPIFGTLKALGFALVWPIALPTAAIIWLCDRRR